MKKFNQFINEGAMDYLKGKSEEEIEEILKPLENLSSSEKFIWIIKNSGENIELFKSKKFYSIYQDVIDEKKDTKYYEENENFVMFLLYYKENRDRVFVIINKNNYKFVSTELGHGSFIMRHLKKLM